MWKGRKIIMRPPEEKDASILQKWFLDKNSVSIMMPFLCIFRGYY